MHVEEILEAKLTGTEKFMRAAGMDSSQLTDKSPERRKQGDRGGCQDFLVKEQRETVGERVLQRSQKSLPKGRLSIPLRVLGRAANDVSSKCICRHMISWSLVSTGACLLESCIETHISWDH